MICYSYVQVEYFWYAMTVGSGAPQDPDQLRPACLPFGLQLGSPRPRRGQCRVGHLGDSAESRITAVI